ncbi:MULTISPECIES: class I SAM-dependent methyltransferase [unclassified Crossiella]|uniref:class I SAM-dependent methyltransferase n=1 Tax=unclassified Crossiella TaxID=2620835 RepID=UPI0020005001|nr:MULTISPECIES: class I SAM-dependent methyltransferase [unclassified Crossiella]MCK2241652.1 class I SAM-dependent methyltransferase [Crossiella sp. S99.2]MCK2255476.1 class I SAM-dependent methyltransferase [Crossiella sp. S99.1]
MTAPARTEPFFGPFATLRMLPLPGMRVVDLYEGFFADFYGGMAENFTADLTWLARRVGQNPAQVLDLCCGTGRLSTLLATAGHTVTAVDNAPAMLARAQRRRAKLSAEVAARCTFTEADVLTLDLGRRFDHVLLSGLSVSTFTNPADRSRLFATAARHLHPGGTLIFDHLPGPTSPDEHREEHDVIPLGPTGAGGFVLAGTRRSAAEGRQTANFYAERIGPDGATDRFLAHNVLAMLAPDRLDGELAEHGFRPAVGELLHPGALLAEQTGMDPAAFTGSGELDHMRLRFVAAELGSRA